VATLDSLFHPLLQLATAIADEPASRPYPQQLRHTIDTLIATASSHCAAAAIPESDFRAALYAIVAFLDELLGAHYSPIDWPPAALTLHYFEDNNAGVGFFSRLERLISEERWSVVRVYQLVLGLGFSGTYALSGDHAGLVTHRRRLATMLGITTGILPLAPAESRVVSPRTAWYAWAPLGIAGASVIAAIVVFAIR
jgi:type VI secretion system protein ImpK